MTAPEDLRNLLQPYDESLMEAYAVSLKVNRGSGGPQRMRKNQTAGVWRAVATIASRQVILIRLKNLPTAITDSEAPVVILKPVAFVF